MKKFMTVVITMMITAVAMMVAALIKFGSINVQTHTNEYVTTCNGVVVSEYNDVVTDKINFNLNVNEDFDIFSR